MKKINKVLTIVLVALAVSLPLAAQCKYDQFSINLLSEMFGINEPTNIAFATKPSSIYEIPVPNGYGFKASASFVKAGKYPYFFLWTNKSRLGGLLDFKKGDNITFYLSGGSKIESACYSDYPGIKGQTISYYPLQKDNLVDLATISVDSILLQCHLQQAKKSKVSKAEDELLVLKSFFKRNVNLIKKWAQCLKEDL